MQTEPVQQVDGLIDRFGRRISYVRLSVTDRCDYRCVYCMSETMEFLPRTQILSFEEIVRLAEVFVSLGVQKLRITGGEPLVRHGILDLLRELGGIAGLRELSLSTNGAQLEQQAMALRRCGVTRINISLDSLRPGRFRRLTRVGDLAAVLRGVQAARRAGFARIKLNSVILRGENDDEILDLVAFARDQDLDISFIEVMPLGLIDHQERMRCFYSSDEVRADIERRHVLIPTTETTGGPSRYFRLDGGGTRIGFISPHSHNFCDSCNRVRVTAEGRMLLCLGQEHSVDLRHVLRSRPGDVRFLRQAIIDAMQIKPRGHDFDLRGKPVILRHMNVTGG